MLSHLLKRLCAYSENSKTEKSTSGKVKLSSTMLSSLMFRSNVERFPIKILNQNSFSIINDDSTFAQLRILLFFALIFFTVPPMKMPGWGDTTISICTALSDGWAYSTSIQYQGGKVFSWEGFQVSHRDIVRGCTHNINCLFGAPSLISGSWLPHPTLYQHSTKP